MCSLRENIHRSFFTRTAIIYIGLLRQKVQRKIHIEIQHKISKKRSENNKDNKIKKISKST